MSLKRTGTFTLAILFIVFLFFYPIDAYVSKPGGAYELAPLVEVQGKDEDQGSFSLLTVSIGKATPFSYVLSTISNRYQLMPVEKVRRQGESDQEYNKRQQKLMINSQTNAITVAFEKANVPYQLEYDGIFVMMVLENGAADGKLQVGDKIRAVDGQQLKEKGQFAEIVMKKKSGDQITLEVEREEELYQVEIVLTSIPGEKRVGLGIQFQEDYTLQTDPQVTFHTNKIGGPSAGLMFTLEIMNQLLEEDLTKGYRIAGTGEILQDGTVGRIGGVGFKVMAADKQKIEILFVPNDELTDEVKALNPGIQTNYEEAMQTAKKIGTNMKIVPVKTIDDALNYLKQLPPKEDKRSA